METSLSRIKQIFDIPGADIRSYSPLTLAYIGDGIYELVIRTILVEQGNCQPQKLHDGKECHHGGLPPGYRV